MQSTGKEQQGSRMAQEVRCAGKLQQSIEAAEINSAAGRSGGSLARM